MAAWRSLYLSHPVSVSVRRGNLRVESREKKRAINLDIEEIDLIVFEGRMFTLTAEAISLLAKNRVSTIFIDALYHPGAAIVPFGGNYLESRWVRRQILMEQDFRDEIWRRVVSAKIEGQAFVLHSMGSGSRWKDVLDLARKVRPGDAGGSEASASAIYFPELFSDPEFRRRSPFPDLRNMILNYGYAVLRAIVARDISANGLLPGEGIWHSNDLNGFSLADDLMEPLRPVFDLYAVKLYKEYEQDTDDILLPEIKKKIVSFFTSDDHGVLLEGSKEETTVRNASKAMVRSFRNCIKEGTPDEIIFPAWEFA